MLRDLDYKKYTCYAALSFSHLPHFNRILIYPLITSYLFLCAVHNRTFLLQTFSM